MQAVMYGAAHGDDLTELRETPFEKELDLQDFLSKHPALLAGDQMNPAEPRRFVLITAEAGVAIAENGSDYFWLDHLFLDQDGIPTLVEVKRGTDTRLRREVIGQMLEYAANACAFWDAAKIRLAFERRCEENDISPEDELNKITGGPEPASATIWDKLAENLKQERLRLVFLADKFPPETQRIVEFLDRQMTTTEVFAVEIRHFAGAGMKTLVPRALNPSIRTADRKSAWVPGDAWTVERFFAALDERHGAEAVAVFRAIYDWAKQQPHLNFLFGNGRNEGSIIIIYQRTRGAWSQAAGDVTIITLWTYGRLEFGLQWLAGRSAFASSEKQLEILRHLRAGSTLVIDDDKIGKRPSVPWSDFQSEANRAALFHTIEWIVEQQLSSAS